MWRTRTFAGKTNVRAQSNVRPTNVRRKNERSHKTDERSHENLERRARNSMDFKNFLGRVVKAIDLKPEGQTESDRERVGD